jgi:hypothetical protein
LSDPGRFASCIERDPVFGCWLWTRGLDRDGYGISYAGGKGPRQAHREVYVELVGPVPDGLKLDHECRRRHCVRPGHLLPVTERENQFRRSWAYLCRIKACRNGHSMSLAIVVPPSHPGPSGRICRECQGPEREERAA